ncbi:MAG TPA: hypothetical protein VGJ54_02595, partial [Streptosporangiaceae bacterium]
MPRQCRTPGRRRPARSGHGAGVRLLALAAGAAVAVLAAAPAAASGSGPARPGDRSQPGKARAVVPPMSVAITSVNPAIATRNAKVTVSGTVTNATGTPAIGLMIQLWSSSARLTSRDAMDSYLTAP